MQPRLPTSWKRHTSPLEVTSLGVSSDNLWESPDLPLLTSCLLLFFLLCHRQIPSPPDCVLCAAFFVPVAGSSIHRGVGIQKFFFKKSTRKSSESDGFLVHLQASPHLAFPGSLQGGQRLACPLQAPVSLHIYRRLVPLLADPRRAPGAVQGQCRPSPYQGWRSRPGPRGGGQGSAGCSCL